MAELHEQSVTEVLEEALDRLDSALRDYWSERLSEADVPAFIVESTPPEEWYSALKKLGQQGFKQTEALAGERFPETYELQTAVESPDIYQGIPLKAAQILAARRFAFELPKLAERVSKLTWLAQDSRPPGRVAKFLQRLGRCYVNGFDGEALILCRTVLEAALAERLDELGRDTDGMALCKLIDFGVDTPHVRGQPVPEDRRDFNSLIHDDFKHHAHLIRVLGNRAVHEDPDPKLEVFDIIEATILLVTEILHPDRGGEGPARLLEKNPSIPDPKAHERMASDHFKKLKKEIEKGFKASPGFHAHWEEHPWLIGALGDPAADVMFVGDTISLPPMKTVRGARGKPPSLETQWLGGEGDRMFREALVLHGFKEPAWDAPVGWRCYLTNLIKGAPYGEELSEVDGLAAAAWPWWDVFIWEVRLVHPVMIVAMGRNVARTIELLEEEDPLRSRVLPPVMQIPHHRDVARQRREQLGPDPISKYVESIGEVARYLRSRASG